jgi:hypothetical protein
VPSPRDTRAGPVPGLAMSRRQTPFHPSAGFLLSCVLARRLPLFFVETEVLRMALRPLAPPLVFATFLCTEPLGAPDSISRTQAAFVCPSTSELDGPRPSSCPACQAFIRHRFLASTHTHPLPPEGAAVRDRIRALGVNCHRFVVVDLRDGCSITGGIRFIGEIRIQYTSLKHAPLSTAAPAEHFENGLT